MRGSDAPLAERISLRSEQGRIELNGARMLIVSAFALGALRRDLISVLGLQRAKGFLLRYGFECGYSDALAVRRSREGRSRRYWTEEAARLHTLEGVARVRIHERNVDWARGQYSVRGVWENSYEAQEHLRLLGASPDASCWTLIGYAGGYQSAVMGRRVLYKEVTCVARGDPECRFVGKTIDLWGEVAEEELAFYTESKIAEELDEAHRRIREQHEMLAQIVSLHDQLTRIVLEGQGCQALAEAVGRMLEAFVAVEDRHLRPLAAWGPSGRSEPSPVFLGDLAKADPAIVERLRRMTGQRRAVELGPGFHPGLAPRFVAPIYAGADLMGYVTLVHRPGANPELMRMYIERAASAIGLELLKERIAVETESRLKGELIEELLVGPQAPAELRDRVRHMGADLDRPHRFLLLCIDGPSGPALGGEGAATSREDLYQALRAELSRSRDIHIVNWRDSILILYYSGPGGHRSQPLIELIREQARKVLPGRSVSIGISRESTSLEELRAVFRECEAVLELQRAFGHRSQVVHVDQLGAFALLYAGTSQETLVAYARRVLGPLLSYDERRNAQLVPTLYWFLTFEGNLKRTAEALNLSISGLKYRLQRLQEIGGFDIGNPETRFDLQLAVRIAMLAGPRGSSRERLR
ncbi:MAG: XylR N-terminal domain-containing protein [Firmicutes bacterium]|nr:XylR N-terminal domain-containing protein [Bacillota bacterium]